MATQRSAESREIIDFWHPALVACAEKYRDTEPPTWGELESLVYRIGSASKLRYAFGTPKDYACTDVTSVIVGGHTVTYGIAPLEPGVRPFVCAIIHIQ